MNSTTKTVSDSEARNIAVRFAKSLNLAPFQVAKVADRLPSALSGGSASSPEWVVYLDFDRTDGFDDDCNFAMVVVNKETGEARLAETL